MKERGPPSTQEGTCRLIPIVRSSARPKPSSPALSGTKGRFYKKYREESASPISSGQDRMGTSAF